MTPVGSLLNPHKITSVVSVPVAAVVTTVAHAPEPIALVPNADVPLGANDCVTTLEELDP